MKAVFAILIFLFGIFCGYQFQLDAPQLSTDVKTLSSDVKLPEHNRVASYVSVSVPVINEKNEADALLTLLGAETPKTQYESYRIFLKLDHLSAEAIQQMLLSMDASKAELRGQIAWFFAGKFPQQAFLLMETSMSDNSMDLAQILFVHLSSNQPEMAFDWLQNNENDFSLLFPVAEQQFARKQFLFQTLSIFPDWKWTAYEKGIELVKQSTMPLDKWSSFNMAQTVAKSNPLEAINYALAQHKGVVDSNLLNGALIEYSKTNPFEAKNLLLENQKHIDDMAVNALVDSFLSRGDYTEAYSLPSQLNDKTLAESVAGNLAGKIYYHGNERVIDFIGTIKDPALRLKTVGSATTSMSVAGYPVEKLLDVLDAGLHDIPAGEKAFNYAWTLNNGYKGNPQSLAVYLQRLKSTDHALAVEVEKTLAYLTKYK